MIDRLDHLLLLIITVLCALSLPACLDWKDPQTPLVESLDSVSCSGAEIVVKGCNFGTKQGDGTISFNGFAAKEIVSWSDSEIRVVVPPGATSGDVVVTIGDQHSEARQIKLEGQGRLTDYDQGASLLRDSTGRLHVFYFTSAKSLIHRYLMNGGTCWSKPTATLTSGGFHGYHVVAGPSGKLHLGYDDGSMACFYRGYNLTTAGSKPNTWTKEAVIATNRCSLGALLLDKSGSLLAFWSGVLAACGMQKYDEKHGSWTTPIQVMTGWYIKAAQTPDGTLHAVARTGTHDEASVVRYSRSADGGKTWSPITILSTSLTAVTAPAVAATSDGGVHVVHGGKNSDGTCNVYHTTSKGGLSWPAESKLSTTKTTWPCGGGFFSNPGSQNLVVTWGDDFVKPAHSLFRRLLAGTFVETHEFLTMGEDKNDILITIPKLNEDQLEFARLDKGTGKMKFNAIPIAHNSDMVYIPGGTAQMGDGKSSEADQRPAHAVELSPYYLDRFEVSNKQYRKCVDAQRCTPPNLYSSQLRGQYWNAPGGTYDNYPVLYVDWSQASAYCKWAGQRLPTEAEWERAARGDWSGKYPWGDSKPTCSLANYYGSPGGIDQPCLGDTDAVNSLKSGASVTGAFHLAGNAAEWVSDWYGADYYKTSPPKDPRGPAKGTTRVIRGGGWRAGHTGLVSTIRFSKLPDTSSHDLGFRCAKSAE